MTGLHSHYSITQGSGAVARIMMNVPRTTKFESVKLKKNTSDKTTQVIIQLHHVYLCQHQQEFRLNAMTFLIHKVG